MAVNMSVAGRDSLPSLPNGGPYFNVVDDDYFATLGARIVRGRGILPDDLRGTTRVAVINEALARHYWPNESPIGRCVSIGDDHGCTEIVGVVQDVLMFALINDERSQIYLPPTHPSFRGSQPGALLIRTTGDSRTVADAVHRELQSMSADMPFVSVRSFEDIVAPDLRAWRLGAFMFSIFGALALVIAAVGLYGALAYAVDQRSREMSVRMALGARGADVIRLVAIEGMRVVVAGVAIGLLVSLAMGRAVAPVLNATSPRDPFVFAVVVLSLLVVSLAAILIPAWRAARIDATAALRSE